MIEDDLIEKMIQESDDTLNLPTDELLAELNKMSKRSQESAAWFEKELEHLKQENKEEDIDANS